MRLQIFACMLVLSAASVLSKQCLPNQVWLDSCVPSQKGKEMGIAFLLNTLPPWDKELKIIDSIGSTGADLSIQTKMEFPWARDISMQNWFEYNLPYANVDEPRNNWRPLFYNKIKPLIEDLISDPKTKIPDVVKSVNKQIWKVLGNNGVEIKFKPSQTPLIYDPMSTIAYGYASCTGVSIVLVDVLRSVGVCARVVGAPAWHNNPQEGNHNWVEVLMESENDPSGYEWGIIEANVTGIVGAKLAGLGETLENPCDKWFCNPDHFGEGKKHTPIFAARWDINSTDVRYPMSWNINDKNVAGVDRSDYYNEVCAKCGTERNMSI